MINGNVNEFVDHIHYGDELVFLYEGKKYFLQGFKLEGLYTLLLDRWDPPGDDYIWVGKGTDKAYPVEKFLNAPIFEGKTFWEAEKEIEWVDC